MDILEILKAFLFGIVEGITEWLPVSSTGHMILLNQIMPLNVSEAFYEVFEVVVQLGAIMAVVVLFWDQIWPFGRKDNPHPMQKTGLLSCVKWDKIQLWLKIVVACLPAAVIGILFDDIFSALFYNYVSVAIALIVFGIAFILIENWRKDHKSRIRSLKKLDYRTVLLIGAFQVLAAIFPGTSRSGATIIGALLLGVSRKVAAEFTFFLAIPVMFGASLLKIVKFDAVMTVNEFALLAIGMLVAYVVSILVIKFLMGYIRKHDFKAFGWYRIILGVIVLAYFLIAGK